MSRLVVVAGPNGSGKSTLTQNRAFGALEIIDPDAIARDLSRDVTRGVEIAAAREALRRQEAAIAAGRSILVETTLAGRGALRLMKTAREAGYLVSLHYVRVNSPDQSVGRVRNRVARGGHDVPEDDIRRRFSRSLANLPEAIALSHESILYDNSDISSPHRRIATVSRAHARTIDRCPAWATASIASSEAIRREFLRMREPDWSQDF